MLHDPLTPEEHINLGLSYEKNGEYDATLKKYKTASEKLPIAYLYIGNMLFQYNNHDEAEKAYKVAIPTIDDPRAHNNLAWLYYIKQRGILRRKRCMLEEPLSCLLTTKASQIHQ